MMILHIEIVNLTLCLNTSRINHKNFSPRILIKQIDNQFSPESFSRTSNPNSDSGIEVLLMT